MDVFRATVVGLFGCTALALGLSADKPAADPGERASVENLFQQGNFKDAYEGFRVLALNAKTDPRLVPADFERAMGCLEQLGRIDELDELRESVVAKHRENWRLFEAVARSYLNLSQQFGAIIAGKFHRGPHRGQGQFVGSRERDRSQAMQLLVRCLPQVNQDADRAATGGYFLTLAQALMVNRGANDAWRLQNLTALDALPEYGDQFSHYGHEQLAGAPVDADGAPIYYFVPPSFEQAKNDGERWRWALSRAGAVAPTLQGEARSQLAAFLLSQFGTQTLLGWVMERGSNDDGDAAASGPFALPTLKDGETIARLATGVKRFTLPDEFNPIKVYEAIADAGKSEHGAAALAVLAAIFENRRQYDRAVEYLKRSQREYGDPDGAVKAKQIDQILGAWGQFEMGKVEPGGRGATIDFKFRNGHRVHFEAHEVRFDQLLTDVKQYLASNPRTFDWSKLDISNIGWRLVVQNQRQYLGRSVAQWDLDLAPRPGHFDKRITVTTPLQKAGVYLLTAHMQDGNQSQIIIWVEDTVLVKKPLAGQTYYFVADSRTGQPIPGATIELFGWRTVQVPGKNEFHVETKALTLASDAQGQLQVNLNAFNDARGYFQWLVVAKAAEGRLAHLGFAHSWGFAPQPGATYDEVREYVITDRPVYRPGSPVRFKFWVARSRYDQTDRSEFAGRAFTVHVSNPKGEKVFTKDLTADDFGGFDGSFELASDAMLGVYHVGTPGYGGGSFRVEEYKKPEFEVSVDAPEKPVMLGEKITATIKAGYYFGGPVSDARVSFKITRTAADDRWYPAGRWDWLFGSGYWWFASDSAWYPGWSRWGMSRPIAAWWGRSQAPPEVVAEAILPIRPDGTLPIEIDTALAKAAHPHEDQRYEITAEITDQSRRTIVGTGTVLVARKPFQVYTWVDRGHYRVGETIEAGVSAQTLARKPVAGKGTLRLLQIKYDPQGTPIETPLESWDLALGADGRAQQSIKAASPGQYRLSAVVDDGSGHTIEGGYLLTITGAGFDGSNFRFNDLEIIPDRKEYRAGETVRLLINTNQVDATVLLFVRPENGVYQAPRVVQLRGKSGVQEVEIATRDMPNIFVEALTVANGAIHDETREVVIPPESRIVDVAVEPSQPTYKPGQKAKVKIKLTAPPKAGEPGHVPFVGSTVLTVYDKSIEYISQGSNVPDIKEWFWKWKRAHHPQTESNLDSWSLPIFRPDAVAMRDLGVFGGLVVEASKDAGSLSARRGRFAGRQTNTGAMLGAPGTYNLDIAAAPMMAMAGAASGAKMLEAAPEFDKKKSTDADPGEWPAIQPEIRAHFADTAFWSAAVTTGPDGTAEVEFPLPESLTTWRIKSWTMGAGTRVGQGLSEVITTKELLVRLQAPRFFVEKDEVILSANVHNKLKTKKSVQVVLEFDGSVLEPMVETTRIVDVEAGSERRVDWRVKVAHEGQAVIRMKALTDEESDAVQMNFPAYVHGMLKTEAVAGTIKQGEERAQVTIHVPAERKPAESRLEVRYSPTLAGALVDALPYLADYPYGCTEQTLNRFLPTVITQKVLLDLGVDLKAIKDKHTNLNAQEIGDARERAAQKRGYEHNPVFDRDEVAKMAAAGLQKLTDMQLSSGGWGWFSGFGEFATPHTTALVVHGLQIARRNDIALPANILERGITWLSAYQTRQLEMLENSLSNVRPFKTAADDLDALVFMVLADADVRNDKMLAFLDRDRTRLSVYAKALFGLALEKLGQKDKLALVLQNINQYVVRDDENQTAFLKLPNRDYWWSWHGSEVETLAFYLKLLARTEPRGDLAPRLVKYVLNNRRNGSYWNSTRDTAFCIEALAEYLKASGEDRPDMTVSIGFDGQIRKNVKINAAQLFSFDNVFSLDGAGLASGDHIVSFAKKGKGPLYFTTYMINFTQEDPITHAGLEIKVDRKMYRLIKDNKLVSVAGGRGESIGQRIEQYRREPIAN